MIMDDLLVAGTDDEEHLRNLEGGLQAVPEVRIESQTNKVRFHGTIRDILCVFLRRDFSQLIKRSRPSRTPLPHAT